jgi:hypothetical protein
VKKQARVAIVHIGVRRCECSKGYFGHCLRGVRAERPLDSDAPSPPVPFFLAPPEGAGGTPGWPPQNLFLETNT